MCNYPMKGTTRTERRCKRVNALHSIAPLHVCPGKKNYKPKRTLSSTCSHFNSRFNLFQLECNFTLADTLRHFQRLGGSCTAQCEDLFWTTRDPKNTDLAGKWDCCQLEKRNRGNCACVEPGKHTREDTRQMLTQVEAVGMVGVIIEPPPIYYARWLTEVSQFNIDKEKCLCAVIAYWVCAAQADRPCAPLAVEGNNTSLLCSWRCTIGVVGLTLI